MFDETIRQLDQIFQAERARVDAHRQRSEADSRRLDGSLLPPDEPPLGRDEGRGTRRGLTNPSEPFIPLPSRTTHGGRFGPAVRAKLRSEVLGRRR